MAPEATRRAREPRPSAGTPALSGRRDTAVGYVLQHRLALLLAGFVVLLDQLGTDWAMHLSAGGATDWGQLGPLGLGYLEAGIAGGLLLPLALGLLGTAGLFHRVAALKQGVKSAAPASELLVLAGAVAALVNLMVRGAVVTPVAIAPLGWGLAPASVVALPAALVLLLEVAGRGRPRKVQGEVV